MSLLKSCDGNLTSQTETLGDHLPEEEEGDNCQDHPQEVEVGAEAEGGEHSRYPDTHPPILLKNF